MAIEIRLPNIKGVTEKEQLLEIQSYLYQLSQQLQYAFETINTTSGEAQNTSSVANQPYPGFSSSGLKSSDAQVTFASLKSLIIKSADIVNAYYDVINKKLEGIYVAESKFGKYAEQTSQAIEANSTAITQTFESTQIIIDTTKEEIYGDLNTIGEDLSYAQQSIVTINSEIEALDSYVANVEGAVNGLDESLKSTKSELSDSVDGAKSELSGMVEDANERIDDTNGSVAGLGEGLNDANSRIAEVAGDLQDSKESINNSIQSVQASVTDANILLEDAKAQLQGSLDDLAVYVTGLQQVIIGVTAYLKSGLLYYTDAGIPVYGLEIGQSVKDELSGEEVFNKYARFTSEKLSFYDNNGNEVAYISDKKLYIRIAEITVAFQIGGLIDLVMDNGDVVTKWVGKG